MTRESLLTLLGFLILLSPFSGLPGSWLTRIDVILGLTIAFIGYTLRKKITSPPSTSEL